MWVGILHDDLDLFRVEQDNSLFLWRLFGGNLHSPFLGRQEKCSIVYLNDFVAQEGWEGFLDVKDVFSILCDLSKSFLFIFPLWVFGFFQDFFAGTRRNGWGYSLNLAREVSHDRESIVTLTKVELGDTIWKRHAIVNGERAPARGSNGFK